MVSFRRGFLGCRFGSCPSRKIEMMVFAAVSSEPVGPMFVSQRCPHSPTGLASSRSSSED